VLSGLQSGQNSLDFPASFGLVACLISAVLALRTRRSGYQNVRQMITRLDQVELCFVLVVVRGNVLRADIDFGRDFFMQDLLRRQRTANVVAEIVERELSLTQALGEFTAAIWRLDLVEFAVNFFI